MAKLMMLKSFINYCVILAIVISCISCTTSVGPSTSTTVDDTQSQKYDSSDNASTNDKFTEVIVDEIPEEGTDLVSDLPPYNGINSMIRTYVTVGGVKYNKGFLMGPTENSPTNFEDMLRWNLDSKYDKVEFYCQYTDDSYPSSNKDRFDVYIDGIKVKTEVVDRNLGLIKFSYDVKNKNTLCLAINHFMYSQSWLAIINPLAVKF